MRSQPRPYDLEPFFRESSSGEGPHKESLIRPQAQSHGASRNVGGGRTKEKELHWEISDYLFPHVIPVA